MAGRVQANSGVPLVSRVSFKIGALFVLTFVVVFIALSAYDIFSSMMESRQAEAGVVVEQSPIVIDPKIQEELQRVLTENTDVNTEAVKDPFIDRAGLSQTAPTQNVGSLSGQASTTSGGGNSPGTTAMTGGQTAPAGPPPPTPLEATKLRYLNWLDRTMNGEMLALDPMIFAIDDLLPVGLVSGGSGNEEILFFSESADRTVSFPLGTRFNDGWLSALRPEGVVFSFDDEVRTIRLKSWGRSVKSKYSRSLSEAGEQGSSAASMRDQ